MRKLVLAVATVSLLGCGGDSTGPGVASAVGTWNLVTVNGSPLPYTVVLIAPSYRLEIVSDRIVANANGTFNETFTYRETENGTVTTTTESDSGTWTQTNASLTITYSDGTTSSAAISGNTITASDVGFVFVYQRQSARAAAASVHASSQLALAYCKKLYSPHSPIIAPPTMKMAPASPPIAAPATMAAPPTIIRTTSLLTPERRDDLL